MKILIRIYRANPLRPHCSAGHHVALCRLIIPLIDPSLCFHKWTEDHPGLTGREIR